MCVAKRIFSRVDYAIFKALWQWALKRHPRKGKRWIMRKYFARRGGRGWCFVGEKKDSGRREIVWLFHATSLPIRRHVKIKREPNPYHPVWEMYFEARESKHMARTLWGRGTLLYLWRTQRGVCAACGDPITQETGWHSHYVIPKVLGIRWALGEVEESQGGHRSCCRFTVITTDPTEVVQPLHDRMPMIITEKDRDRWLQPGDPDLSAATLRFRQNDSMEGEYGYMITEYFSALLSLVLAASPQTAQPTVRKYYDLLDTMNATTRMSKEIGALKRPCLQQTNKQGS
jgi:hypothetical protein